MYYLICPNVIFTVEPENIRKRFDFREVQKTAMGRNWSKVEEITMSTDVIISHTENTLHLLCSMHSLRQFTIYRQSSPSGFPSSYLYKLRKSTLHFQLVFPFLKVFVSFYHNIFSLFLD